jgi:hypothetical protein
LLDAALRCHLQALSLPQRALVVDALDGWDVAALHANL